MTLHQPDAESWDTGEIILWLNNDEQPYYAARDVAARVLDGFNSELVGRMMMSNIHTGARVDRTKVDWGTVLHRFIDDLKEERENE